MGRAGSTRLRLSPWVPPVTQSYRLARLAANGTVLVSALPGKGCLEIVFNDGALESLLHASDPVLPHTGRIFKGHLPDHREAPDGPTDGAVFDGVPDFELILHLRSSCWRR